MTSTAVCVAKKTDVIELLKSVGITARKLDPSEALSKSWVIPSNDRRGMIKIKFKEK